MTVRRPPGGRDAPRAGDELDLDLALLCAQASGTAALRDALDNVQGIAAIRACRQAWDRPDPAQDGYRPQGRAVPGRTASRSPPTQSPPSQLPAGTQPRKGNPS